MQDASFALIQLLGLRFQMTRKGRHLVLVFCWAFLLMTVSLSLLRSLSIPTVDQLECAFSLLRKLSPWLCLCFSPVWWEQGIQRYPGHFFNKPRDQSGVRGR